MTAQPRSHSSEEIREEGFEHYQDGPPEDDRWMGDQGPDSLWLHPDRPPSVAEVAQSKLRHESWEPDQPDLTDCVAFLRNLHRPIDPAIMALPPLEAAPSERQAIEWEYKIVRSKRPIFGNPATFAQLCREEALAGWILLEKFDNRRVRFKRPSHLREDLDPASLPFDPYRTRYRAPWNPRLLGGLAALLAVAIVPAYAGYTWVSVQLLGPWRDDLPRPSQRQPPTPPRPIPPTPELPDVDLVQPDRPPVQAVPSPMEPPLEPAPR
jgi:hypothetical protein